MAIIEVEVGTITVVTDNKKSVVIIGAGISGLSAAYYLTKNGLNVTVVEATNSIGGRLTALFDSISQETIDNGQHALMTAYHTFFEILGREKFTELIKIQKSLRVNYLDTLGAASLLNCGYLPGKAGQLAGFLNLKGISFKSKIAIIKLLLKISHIENSSISNTCYEFLKIHNQYDDAISRFWEPFIIATMNTELKDASAKILINILKKAFIEDTDNSRLAFPKYDFPHLLKIIENKIIELGGVIQYSNKVSKLLIDRSQVTGIFLNNDTILKADYYVSSVQAFSLSKMFDDDNVNFKYLSKFSYSPIISVYIWLDIELFDVDFVSVLNSDIQWIFNRRKILNKESEYKFSYSYSITISAASKYVGMAHEKLIGLLTEELIKLFPNFDKSHLLHYRIITEKFATFRQTVENEKLRPKAETSLNNFFIAGDWTDTGLPATIESGAFSGKRVAEKIITLTNQ